MPGIRVLRQIQLGHEATKGTAVAATARWRGIGVVDDQLEIVFPREDIASISGKDRSYIPKLLAAINLESVEATFEQLPYILSASIVDLVTGVADGAGSDFIYTYAFPTTTVPTIETYTIEGGDDQQAEEFAFGFVTDFILSGAAGEAVMMESNWVGRQAAPTTFTASIALPAVEDILFQKGKLYIDAVSGTIGTTQISNSLLAMELSYVSGFVPVWTADGDLFFSFEKMSEPEVLLTLTFEHDTASVAQKANWKAETPQQARLEFEGSAFTTGGTTYSVHTLRIDLAGKWERFEPLGEQDGNDIYSATFRVRENDTASLFGSIVVANEVSALP